LFWPGRAASCGCGEGGTAADAGRGRRPHLRHEIIAETLQQSALAFGLKRVVHPNTAFFYIRAPGSQGFRIVSDPAP